ncbi:MAG: hypothetical protein GTN43_01405 [Candidatus Aenigmarchaeota archaeon]|nr:hypothetical protein [Candidatus Aenigmarchaeota archaeon]
MDGVGSKILCYQEKDDVSDAAFDLVGANVHDVGAEFIEPLVILDDISFHKPDQKIAEQLGKGLSKVASKYDFKIGGGETASHPHQIKRGKFLWGGTALGTAGRGKHEERIKKRDNLRSGLYIVGIESYDSENKGYSVQANGFTLLRELAKIHKLEEKVTNRTLLEELTAPSLIVSSLMTELTYRNLIHFFAPITGSGYRNIARVLPKNLNAELDFEVRDNTIFKVVQDSLKVSEKEMYKVLNMGHVITIGTDKPGHVISVAMERGLKAREIGEIKEGKGEVIVNGINVGRY